MKKAAGTTQEKDFQLADSLTEYEIKCFACGAPVEWYQDICDSCQKLTDLHCT